MLPAINLPPQAVLTAPAPQVPTPHRGSGRIEAVIDARGIGGSISYYCKNFCSESEVMPEAFYVVLQRGDDEMTIDLITNLPRFRQVVEFIRSRDEFKGWAVYEALPAEF